MHTSIVANASVCNHLFDRNAPQDGRHEGAWLVAFPLRDAFNRDCRLCVTCTAGSYTSQAAGTRSYSDWTGDELLSLVRLTETASSYSLFCLLPAIADRYRVSSVVICPQVPRRGSGTRQKQLVRIRHLRPIPQRMMAFEYGGTGMNFPGWR